MCVVKTMRLTAEGKPMSFVLPIEVTAAPAIVDPGLAQVVLAAGEERKESPWPLIVMSAALAIS